jgi:mannose-6-phosphate isomerase-like protein (cupin superfamily)/catechol 2,3-dioxygenase-like lactoylglutathione lyase family enzyme
MTVTEEPVRSGERHIATERATSRAWWFLGTLAVLRNPEGAPRTPAVIELTVPPGGSPPRHVHEALDDAFLLLDGEVVVRCGEQTFVARPGAYVVLPHGVEHTFRVTSSVPARMLQVHADDSFLRFIEALGTPTTDLRLPPPGDFDLDPDALMRASAEHGAPMVGPPLAEEEARRFVASPSADPGLGPVNHMSVTVTDLPRSERWYTETFGLIRVDGDIADDGTGHVALLSPSGGWIVTLASATAAGVDHLALTCTDRDALVRWRELLAERGVQPGTITDAPYGSGFVVRDPDGLDLELFAPAPAPA